MDITRLDQNTMQANLERCVPLVAGLEESEPRVPVRVLVDESWVVADVIEDHFKTATKGGKTVLGLETLVSSGQLSENSAAELREFGIAIRKVQSDYDALLEAHSKSPVERGEHIASELRAALSFLLEDGDQPDEEEVLDRLRDKYEANSSQSVLAASLEGFAALGMRHKEALSALMSFDEALLDEAVQVAAALRQHMADRISGDTATKQKELLSLRNRLITGLTSRLRNARRAVRYVFRDYPDIARKVGSEYERNRRARQRQNRAPTSGVQDLDETQVPTGTVASN